MQSGAEQCSAVVQVQWSAVAVQCRSAVLSGSGRAVAVAVVASCCSGAVAVDKKISYIKYVWMM